MSKTLLAAVLLLSSASASFAYAPTFFDVNSLSGKAMSEHPGVTGRSKGVHSLAKPEEYSLSGHEMRLHPGNRGGSAVRPGNKHDESMSEKSPFEIPADG